MRTFGRVLACMGLGIAGIGAIGAVAMLPPGMVEERRQALRAHLPEMPPMDDLITGKSEADCAEASDGDPLSGKGAGASPDARDDGAAGCANKSPEVGVLRGGASGQFTRSGGGPARLRPPAPGGETAGN